jgi:acyl dehydratase
VTRTQRQLVFTPELIQAYSRRGNFHSDAETASSLGLPGLVAQGVQVAGPAYGVLLDTWGEEFLARGEWDCKFVGMVTDGHEVTARVDVDDDRHTARFEVTNDTTGATAVVGTAAASVRPR